MSGPSGARGDTPEAQSARSSEASGRSEGSERARAGGATLAGVSGQLPQNYMIHTVVLFAVLVAAMVVFLVHQWG